MKNQLRDYLFMLLDCILICIASVIASSLIQLITYKYTMIEIYGYTMLIALLCELLLLFIFRIYKVIIKFNDVEYNVRIAVAVIIGAFVSFLIMGIVFDWRLAAAYNLIEGMCAFSGILLVRLFYQVNAGSKERRKQRNSKKVPTMVVGAGWTGNRVHSDQNEILQKTYSCLVLHFLLLVMHLDYLTCISNEHLIVGKNRKTNLFRKTLITMQNNSN